MYLLKFWKTSVKSKSLDIFEWYLNMIVFHLVGKKHALPSAKNVVSGHLACYVQDWGMDINLRIK